jgi:hypothetical protein
MVIYAGLHPVVGWVARGEDNGTRTGFTLPSSGTAEGDVEGLLLTLVYLFKQKAVDLQAAKPKPFFVLVVILALE